MKNKLRKKVEKTTLKKTIEINLVRIIVVILIEWIKSIFKI